MRCKPLADSLIGRQSWCDTDGDPYVLKHFTIILALLMTIGTQVSAELVTYKKAILILSNGKMLMSLVKGNSVEYHIIYDDDFYWCHSYLADEKAHLYCVNNRSVD